MKFLRRILLFMALVFSSSMQAQDTISTGTALLDKLISEEKITEANQTLSNLINNFTQEKIYDSLPYYSYYVGSIELLRSNKSNAKAKAEDFVDNIKTLTQNPSILRQSYMSMSSLYDLLGMPDEGYKANEQALHYSKQIPGDAGRLIGVIHSNLGTSSMRLGNIKDAIYHGRKTLEYYKQDPTATATDFYFGYSAMGTSMYFSSKLDSAIYFYEKAVEEVQKSEANPVNLYYRPSLLLNNIAGLYSMNGQTAKSLDAMKKSLDFNAKFINSDGEDYKRQESKRSRLQGIDNLADIYQSIGDYKKAHELLEYATSEKAKLFTPENPEILKAKVLLGQSHIFLHNYQEAALQLDEAMALIKSNSGTFLSWDADAHYGRAKIYEAQKKIDSASIFYERSQSLFEQSQQGSYDEVYLKLLKRIAIFHASNNEAEKALTAGNKSYNYVLKTQGPLSLPTIQHALTLAEVHYKLDNFEQTREFAQVVLTSMDTLTTKDKSIDGIRLEAAKPKALLLLSKAEYASTSKKDSTFLKEIYSNMEQAISVLNEQKLVITNPESVSLLNAENKEVYEYAKKITSELYQLTGNKKYLDKTLGFHEANVYQRIRSRLNSKEAIKFSKVSDTVFENEARLKKNISDALLSENGDIENYIEATAAWEVFQEELRVNYPEYYQLRYGSVIASINEIQQKIDSDQTAIRYLFIEEALYAIVLTANSFHLEPLEREGLEADITILQSGAHQEAKITEALHRLYQNIWQPIASKVNTKHVLIIPDGILYNLSFETLTPTRINSFEEIALKSLLSKHVISYNFSLQLVSRRDASITYSNNFIGFAPGFSEKLKNEYLIQVKDSVDMDYTYATLLPQPFSIQLIQSSKKELSGDAFLESAATETNFLSEAPKHKIIHIGTHAESNNISPELSRLVFSKTNGTGDNYLYNYEIYNTNLSTHLAVLTACETGKPEFQPGEGMISLAHAFNYAGSESMLTSLWKIDEKSSAKIIGYFYENIKDGLRKDEALQQAKLTYLSKAQGRTLAPQYWAGLVLIGDTSPILIDQPIPLWVWVIGAILLVVFIVLFFNRRK